MECFHSNSRTQLIPRLFGPYFGILSPSWVSTRACGLCLFLLNLRQWGFCYFVVVVSLSDFSSLLSHFFVCCLFRTTCSGLSPGFALRDHIGCQGWNLDQPCARQLAYPLYYYSGLLFYHFLKALKSQRHREKEGITSDCMKILAMGSPNGTSKDTSGHERENSCIKISTFWKAA